MPKYVAKRKDVCGGQLLKKIDMSYKIVDELDNEVTEQDLADAGIFNFSISGGKICRGMLYNVNENGLANDLIYTTPTNYPIKGIDPKVASKSDFFIDNYVELDELLKYLKYGVDLTQRDLNEISRRLITHRYWLEHNMELFGWKKSSVGYSSGGKEILPVSIYHELSSINCTKNGKPYKEEPEYSLIRRKK